MGGCIRGKGRVDPTPRLGGIRDMGSFYELTKLSFLLYLMKREEDPKTQKTNISLFFILYKHLL